MTSVNAFFRSVLDDLVEKRLWPVAAVLLLALVGIPVLLSKPAGEQPVSAPPAATPAVGAGGPLAAFAPVVNTEGKKSSEIRKDLEGFETKNPFKPQNVGGGGGGGTGGGGSVEVQGGDTTVTSGSGGGPDVSDSPPLGTSGGGGGGDTSSGSSGTGTETEIFYYAYTAEVRFGKKGNLDRKTLSQFRALPSSKNPVVVFMGVRQDGKTAVFLVSSAAATTGDGDCEPDDTCTLLYMSKGDKQSFEAVNSNDEVVTFKLVLLDIDVKRTDGPEEAKKSSRAKTSRGAKSSKRARRTVAKAEQRTNVFARGFQAFGF